MSQSPYRAGGGYASRNGLSARQPLFGGAGHSDQQQINIEAGHPLDFDSEIEGLRASVGRLKHVSTAIQEETQLTQQVMDSLVSVYVMGLMGLGVKALVDTPSLGVSGRQSAYTGTPVTPIAH